MSTANQVVINSHTDPSDQLTENEVAVEISSLARSVDDTAQEQDSINQLLCLSASANIQCHSTATCLDIRMPGSTQPSYICQCPEFYIDALAEEENRGGSTAAKDDVEGYEINLAFAF